MFGVREDGFLQVLRFRGVGSISDTILDPILAILHSLSSDISGGRGRGGELQ